MENWYRKFQGILTESSAGYSVVVTEWKDGSGLEDDDDDLDSGDYHKEHYDFGPFPTEQAAKDHWAELCKKHGEPNPQTMEVGIHDSNGIQILQYRNGRWS